MSPVRRFANIARALFFATALAAAGIVSIWMWAPQWVDHLDAYALKRYEKHYENKYFSAVEGLQQSPTEAIPRMEAFARSIDGVKKGDKLAQMKRVILTQLTRACLRQKLFDKALFWAEQWTLFDPRDFDAMLIEVDVLLATPGKEDLGKEKLLELSETYPDVQSINRRAIAAGLRAVPRQSP